jgi:hypothetical protein
MLNPTEFSRCDACDTLRRNDELANNQSDFMTCALPVRCDGPSPVAQCEGCEGVDLIANLIGGGEYEPNGYRCYDCHRSHLEALHEARLEELAYWRATR